MIVTLTDHADVDHVRRALTGLGLWIESLERSERGPVHLIVARASSVVPEAALLALDGVKSVSLPRSRHPRVDAQGSRVQVGEVVFGGELPVLIAGPCAVESEAQIARIAAKLAGHGVRILRGGAFKPRTSPYDFQGRGKVALGWLRRAADAVGMGVVSEVMSERDLDDVASVVDLLQVGSRNMQNYALLQAVGGAGKPVLLKRAMSATIEEWLHAGEYLLVHGASGVVFCERGLRGFDPSTRNLLDLGAVALLARVHRLPVVVDPSHAAGRRDLILPLARAALAAGAHGVMIEVHDEPAAAESDGAQALEPEALAALAAALTRPGSE
ncbi:MAG: 3-deoxy-7-phosphoheptulonate synthase [Myxococcales bacterium]|nr:3-deoxy-7-phosphoheptulonate synthase [Myxococcales bacterium]